MKRFVIGLAISLAALWWAFRGLEWQSFGDALAGANIWGLLAATAFLLAAGPVRGLRWRIFMAPVQEVPLRLTVAATYLLYFGNNVLPLRLGELLRTYYVSRRAPAPLSQVFGSVLVERVVDYFNFLVLLALLPLMGVPEEMTPLLGVAIVGGVAVGLVTIWLVRRQGGERSPVEGRLGAIFSNLQLAFASLRQGQHYLTLVLTSIGIWGLYLTHIHITLLALDLDVSLADSYLVLIAVTFIASVPISPGYIGTYHLAVVLVLDSILGMDTSHAQAAAVVLHATGFISYTLIGAVIYFRSHLQLRDVRAQEEGSSGEASL